MMHFGKAVTQFVMSPLASQYLLIIKHMSSPSHCPVLVLDPIIDYTVHVKTTPGLSHVTIKSVYIWISVLLDICMREAFTC